MNNEPCDTEWKRWVPDEAGYGLLVIGKVSVAIAATAGLATGAFAVAAPFLLPVHVVYSAAKAFQQVAAIGTANAFARQHNAPLPENAGLTTFCRRFGRELMKPF